MLKFKNGDKILCKKDYHENEWSNTYKEIFDDITIPMFKEGEYYTVTNVKPDVWFLDVGSSHPEDDYIEVNKKVIEKKYFYSKIEERKLKLEKIDKRSIK